VQPKLQEIELIAYLLIFALSIIWSSFAINRKSAPFSFLTMTTWFTLATMHLALAYDSMFMDLIWMFYGVGVFFMIYGVGLMLLRFQVSKNEKEWEIA